MRDLASLLVSILLASGSAPAAGEATCGVFVRGKTVEVRSPFVSLRLDAASSLLARSLRNRLTGRVTALGGGPELAVDIVGIRKAPETLELRVTKLPTDVGLGRETASFELSSHPEGIRAVVTYRSDARQPIVRKTAQVVNVGDRPVRLLNVRLGEYATDAKATGGGQGFPAYLDDQAFLTLAHPAGWAKAEGSRVTLAQYPGILLAPGQRFECMETVLGVGRAGHARDSFLAHLRSRMRRVVRGHDKAYAIFEPFGARPDGDFNESEAFVLDSIGKLAEGQREAGCHFDLYSVDFWVDYHGDLKGFDPQRFPNGLTRTREELAKLGTAPGLWIDSSWEAWSIGGNPLVQSALNYDPAQGLASVPWGRKSFCRATEPIRSMYTEAFRYHVRENGVRLLKFDNFASVCNNPNHDHLPGLYSTEPIDNAVIEFLHALDEECPEVFLMLYWGYSSPWWLLHADTLFDSGLGIEAASPSDFPAPYGRDAVTQKLDQAQWRANDIPPLGKDSLGVWLSSWGWNSSIGKERWQEGFVMDISRGSLLAQPWSDTAWLSPPERKQMADFIALLKARPECFGNPRFVLGSPWNGEPYGYCCTDGRRAFLALSNCTWQDSMLRLQLGPAWGLPAGRRWDIYRWYPGPARLRGNAAAFGSAAAIALRPFEVVLLEVVPSGQPPSLSRKFETEPIPVSFAEASRELAIAVGEKGPTPEAGPAPVWTTLKPTGCRSAGGATLKVLEDDSILASGANPSSDTYSVTTTTNLQGITAVRLDVLPEAGLPGNGPGRAVNGNFALTELTLEVALADGGAQPVRIGLQDPIADFSQTAYGGWPIAAALDGDPQTGWSIDPAEGQPHVAIFRTEKPFGYPAGTTLTFAIKQWERGHTIGRLRLSVTASSPPIPLPQEFLPRPKVLRGQLPPSRTGGLLAVTAQMSRNAKPEQAPNTGSCFTAEGSVSGQAANWTPIFGQATYPSSWQGWRVVADPATAPRTFELTVDTTLPPGLDWAYRAHFLPG